MLHRPRPSFVESLEGRTLLASSAIDYSNFVGPLPADVYALYFPAHASTSATPAARTASAGDDAPDLVGRWTGRVKVKIASLFSHSESFRIDITRQTDDTLTGSVTARGRTYRGTIPYTFDGDTVRFSYGERGDDLSGSLTLTLNDAGDAARGSFRGDGFGRSIKGSVSLTKLA